MIGRIGLRGDPFEGSGAYRRRLRLRAEGFVALTLAVAACGLTAAMWVRTLAPIVEGLLKTP
jgi:hypothetical protein